MRLNALIFDAVSKSFSGHRFFELLPITHRFEKNYRYGIVGCSGSGKSTFMSLAAGTDAPTRGNIVCDFKNKQVPLHSVVQVVQKQHIGIVFQAPHLIGELTALENIVLRGIIAGLSKENAEREAKELLERLELGHLSDAYPPVLSGGQQQRVCLARALIIKPDFLLADEPTSALDEKTGKEIIGLILEYQKKYQMGLIISTHDQVLLSIMHTIIEIKNAL
jgi:ABC-type lipoprotein export system ATPase subunit